METTAILIVGPPGAGKTSILEKLGALLEIEGVEYGALESEHFGWGNPWFYGPVVTEQVSAVLTLQRQAGRRLFLITATTETDAELANLISATAADRVITLLLIAAPDVVASRIRDREPDDWPGKQRLVDHARELSQTMPELKQIDFTINTEQKQASDVARELLAELRQIGVFAYWRS